MKCGNSHSSQDYQTAKHDFRKKHRRSNSHVVRIGGFETRAREQLHVRSDGQLEWNRTWTTENPQHDATTKTGIFWKQWYIIQTTSGESNTMPTRQHPELGQAHCARMEHDSTQRVTAGQAGHPLCTFQHHAPSFSASRNTSASRFLCLDSLNGRRSVVGTQEIRTSSSCDTCFCLTLT